MRELNIIYETPGHYVVALLQRGLARQRLREAGKIMNGLDAARKVVEEKQCHLLRPRKDSPGEYDAKPYGEGSKRGWFYLDLFSASAIVNVHDALSEQNRAKFAALPLPKMASVAFKLIK